MSDISMLIYRLLKVMYLENERLKIQILEFVSKA